MGSYYFYQCWSIFDSKIILIIVSSGFQAFPESYGRLFNSLRSFHVWGTREQSILAFSTFVVIFLHYLLKFDGIDEILNEKPWNCVERCGKSIFDWNALFVNVEKLCFDFRKTATSAGFSFQLEIQWKNKIKCLPSFEKKDPSPSTFLARQCPFRPNNYLLSRMCRSKKKIYI